MAGAAVIQMERIIAVLNDVFFAVKIITAAESLGKMVVVVRDRQTLSEQLSRGDVNKILADLNFCLFDPVEAIKEIKQHFPVRVIGYYSHVDIGLRNRAKEHCDTVLPRSVFFQNLPDLL